MSSTCEIIYQIISSYSKKSLTKDICEYLYSGILNDTNCFSRRLSNKTLTITPNDNIQPLTNSKSSNVFNT